MSYSAAHLFVADGCLHLSHELWRNIRKPMILPGVLSSLFEDLFLGSTTGLKIAVNTNVPATQHFSHGFLLASDLRASILGYGAARTVHPTASFLQLSVSTCST